MIYNVRKEAQWLAALVPHHGRGKAALLILKCMVFHWQL